MYIPKVGDFVYRKKIFFNTQFKRGIKYEIIKNKNTKEDPDYRYYFKGIIGSWNAFRFEINTGYKRYS